MKHELVTIRPRSELGSNEAVTSVDVKAKKSHKVKQVLRHIKKKKGKTKLGCTESKATCLREKSFRIFINITLQNDNQKIHLFTKSN